MLVDMSKKLSKAFAYTESRVASESILLLPFLHVCIEQVFKRIASGKVVAVEVNMKHRVCLPIIHQITDGKSIKQSLLAPKVIFKCRHKQALAESTRATQKVNLSFCNKTVYQCGFVHICISVFYYSLEVLYAYRIFHKLFYII